MSPLSNWTAVYERKENSWVAWCAEVPEAGAVGHSLAEARQLLNETMELVLRERREADEMEELLVGGAVAG